MQKHLKNLPRRMILCNSFWGLERATLVSPNVRMTGGLAESKYAKMVKKIRQTDGDLFEWLEKAHVDGRRIIYINLGEEIEIKEWMVDRIFEGLHLYRRKADNRAQFMWIVGKNQISEDHLSNQDKDLRIFRDTPSQAEVLHHPAVIAGITAGEFTYCLDFINAGIPLMTLPHHARQAVNSIKLVEAGCCRILINPSQALQREGITKKDFTYDEPNFTVREFSDNLQLLVQEEKFTERAKFLQRTSQALLGSKMAVDVIEETVMRNEKETAEMPEMVDLNLIERQRQLNGFSCCCCYFIVTAFIVFGIWGISNSLATVSKV